MRMAITAPRMAAPVAPAAALSGKAQEEFGMLKRSLNEIASWDMSPNTWDKIQIIYSGTGSDKQAKGFIASIELPTPQM